MGIHFEIQQVSPRTVAVIDEKLPSNAGAILLDDYIVAVDATMRPDTSRTFRSMLEEKYQRPVKYLCVTHYHGDHVFGLKSFRDVTIFASGAIVENMRRRMSSDWSPQGLAAWKKGDPAAAEWLDDVEFIFPSVFLYQRIDLVNRDMLVEFHHAGGHTSCSVFGYYPDEKVLFAGDLIFAGQMPFAGDVTCNPEKWMAALKTWLGWEIEHVIPGHGPVTGMTEIRKHLDFFELLKKATLDVIHAGKEPQDITMPGTYIVSEKEQGLVERTKKRWFEFYKTTSEL
jgi:glyoxylase-like metal-dependent hydrolase (beta-lactamase superfamily II)